MLVLSDGYSFNFDEERRKKGFKQKVTQKFTSKQSEKAYTLQYPSPLTLSLYPVSKDKRS